VGKQHSGDVCRPALRAPVRSWSALVPTEWADRGRGSPFHLRYPKSPTILILLDHRDPNKTYAVREDENGKLVYLEDEIMNPAPDEFVVHLNGDTLDNSRSNLRVVKQSNPELS
jgi:hypothetical protein